MQKLFYLLFDSPDRSGSEMGLVLREKAAPEIRASGATGITVYANDEDVSGGLFMVRRSDPPIRAMLSFWLDDAAERVPAEAVLRSHAQGIAGYLVVESRPMPYERPIGDRVKGMKQITCIARRPDVSIDEFHRIWHGDHRQVAIDTQSTFGYVRNEIFRSVTDGAPDAWAAFVEESFPSEALTDPKVFYNNVRSEAELDANMKKMMDSCNRFLDPEPMEVTYVSEYFLG